MPKEQVYRSDSQTLDGAEAQSRRTLEHMLWIGAAGAAVVVVVNLAFYFETRAWQMLLVVAGELLAIAGLFPTIRTMRQGKLEQAVCWMDASIVMAFGLPELVHAGGTFYFLIGCVLMILISGRMTLPHRPIVWLAYSGGFAIYVGAIELINSIWHLPRYDITQSVTLGVAAPVIVGLICILMIWQLVQAYRGITTIRMRLLAGFVAMVALPVVATASVVAIVNFQSSQKQTIQQLDSILALKENQVKTWLSTMSSELPTVLPDQEEGKLVATLVQEPLDSPAYQDAYSRVATRFRQVLRQIPTFEELFILSPQGKVVLSTNIGKEHTEESNQEYFRRGLEGRFVSTPFRLPQSGEMTIVAARPVLDTNGKTVGVLAGRANPVTLQLVMQQRQISLSERSEGYMVSQNFTLLTTPSLSKYHVGDEIEHTFAIRQALEAKADGSGRYTSYGGRPVLGVYRWSPEIGAAFIAEQEQTKAFQGAYQTLLVIGAVALGALGLAVAASLAVTRSIAMPLANLAQTAEQIASGDLTLTAPIETRDEIATLAQAFNSMTTRLRTLINSLETQVKERTAQLSASAEVGRAASSILDVPALMTTVVNLITDRFDYYYAAVFLLDESGRYAVLKEGTGEAGRLLKAHGHQLEVSFTSMVGTAISTGQPRITLHAETEARRFVNPLLPDTHSEIALPLRLGGRIIGALDVQSTQPGAFDEASAAVLQSMADQIAVALGNARLYTEIQQRAREQEGLARIAALAGSTLNTEALLDRLMNETKQLLGAELSAVLLKDEARHSLVGRYIAADGTAMLSPGEWIIPLDTPGFEKSIFAQGSHYSSSQGSEDPNVIPAYRPYMEALRIRNFCGVALRARGQSLGELYVGNRSQGFGPAEMSLLQTIGGYAANAIQNVQLFEESQRLAGREQTINAIATRIRAGLAMDQVLQATATEIGQRMGAARAAVRLKGPDGNGWDKGRQ